MQLRNDRYRYGAVAQLFHWLTVVLITALLIIAFYMTDLPLGPEKLRIYNLHKSVGVTVLLLTILRVMWRQFSPAPPLPTAIPSWERTAARAHHFLLYGVLFAQPMIGILHSWSANFPVVIYGLFALPNLTGQNEALQKPLQIVHAWLGWTFLVLVLVHVAAALRHHFVLKDSILRRILPRGLSKDITT